MTEQSKSRSDDARQSAADWVRVNTPDCGDNSCMFGGRGKGGMRTNVGCRCFRELPTMKRIFVERMFAALSERLTPSETSVLAANRLRVAMRYSTFHDRPTPCDEITCADEILRLSRPAERNGQ